MYTYTYKKISNDSQRENDAYSRESSSHEDARSYNGVPRQRPSDASCYVAQTVPSQTLNEPWGEIDFITI